MSRSLHIEVHESAEELKRIMNEQARAKFRERIQIIYFQPAGYKPSPLGGTSFSAPF